MNNENTRSTAHASASGVQLPKGWPSIDYVEVEHIQAVGPDDHVSRLARDHAEARVSERAQALELGWSDEPTAKKAARVPREPEPCNLVAFCGIVSGAVAAALGAAALLGWSINVALKWAGWM